MSRTYEEFRLELVLRDLDTDRIEVEVHDLGGREVIVPVKRMYDMTAAEYDEWAEREGHE